MKINCRRLHSGARRATLRLGAVVVCLALLGGGWRPSQAAALLADPSTGVAIFGYDPVSYQLDGAARGGSPAVTAQVEGVIWRFTSDANRNAFLDDPASYAPQLGGYDGAGLSRGFVAAGDPEIFAVLDGALYFFRSCGQSHGVPRRRRDAGPGAPGLDRAARPRPALRGRRL